MTPTHTHTNIYKYALYVACFKYFNYTYARTFSYIQIL